MSETTCSHDPDEMILLHGETADEAFVFEPKSVVCGQCGRAWRFRDHDAARVLADAVDALRELANAVFEKHKYEYNWRPTAEGAALKRAKRVLAAHPDLTAEGGAGR